MATSVTEYLYRVSLEPPAQWFMLVGSGLEKQPPYLNIGGCATSCSATGARAVAMMISSRGCETQFVDSPELRRCVALSLV